MDRAWFRGVCNERLEHFVRTKLNEFSQYEVDGQFAKLMGYLYTYIQEGKRFRPYMIYLCYHAFGGSDEDRIWELCLVNELIHLFALIHDDIIDKGEVRHSHPTYHLHAASLYTKDAHHVGSGQAMLIGDWLLIWALEQFAQFNESSLAMHHMFTLLKEVIYGEMVDVHMSYVAPTASKELIETKDKLKSGRYSFMRPMVLGAAYAWVQDTKPLERLGDELGLAFQMRDDLLDIVDEHSNKTLFSDYHEGNQTYILRHLLDVVDDEQRAYVLEWLWLPVDDERRDTLLWLFESSGTIAWAKEQISQRLDGVRWQIDEVFPAGQWHDALVEIVDYLYMQ